MIIHEWKVLMKFKMIFAAFPRRIKNFFKNRRPGRVTRCIRESAFHSPVFLPPSSLFFSLSLAFACNSDPVSFHPSRFMRRGRWRTSPRVHTLSSAWRITQSDRWRVEYHIVIPLAWASASERDVSILSCRSGIRCSLVLKPFKK